MPLPRVHRCDSKLERRCTLLAKKDSFFDRFVVPLEKLVAKTSVFERLLPSFEVLLVCSCASFQPWYVLRRRDGVRCNCVLTTASVALRLGKTLPKQARGWGW